MKTRFVKNAHIFETTKKASGKVILSYRGKENDYQQGCIWICDSEAEVMDMVDAVIDPKRYPDDEYYARHIEELHANCKW